ncbi:hypothetical protein [Lactobacillus nasalidis]|nr:hypothetical protein [Lactobacillus nasalidis]
MTKEQFKASIIDGIKAGRLDACNGVEFGEVYTNLPQYYWCVKGDEVTEDSPLYVDNEQPKLRFGVTVADIEDYTVKDFEELSDSEVKQAMLDIVNDYGVDDWYDQYQEEA